MKKIILYFLFITILICSITACTSVTENISNNSSTNDTTNSSNYFPDGPYSKMSADWPIYANTNDLIEEADLVFIGKITDIEFQVLDLETAEPVSETTPDYLRMLHTIYSIEIITPYKGDTTNITNFRMMGGMVDYCVDEQLEIMEQGKAYGQKAGIPVWDSYQKAQCTIGESYLFVLCQFETGAPTILNLEQSIYKLDDPLRKQTIGNNDNVYYFGEKDEYNRPLISVKDIITEFGQDKWNAFNSQWENDIYKFKTNSN